MSEYLRNLHPNSSAVIRKLLQELEKEDNNKMRITDVSGKKSPFRLENSASQLPRWEQLQNVQED